MIPPGLTVVETPPVTTDVATILDCYPSWVYIPLIVGDERWYIAGNYVAA